MKIICNENNPATLKLLIAANLGQIAATLEIIHMRGWTILPLTNFVEQVYSSDEKLFFTDRTETVQHETTSDFAII